MSIFKIMLEDNNSIVFDSSKIKFYYNNDELRFNEMEYTKKRKRIAISLGFSCNMKCEYCIQSKKEKKRKTSAVELDKIVSDLIEKENFETSRIEFWGGEPLLYKDEITYIITKLKNYIDKSKLSFLIITNGILLDLEFVKYCKENNISVVLSHDATNQEIRGVDPLDDVEVVKAIKWLIDNNNDSFSINTVLTKENLNTKDRLEYFYEKLDRRNFHHSGEGFVYNSNYIIDNEQSELTHNILKDLFSGSGTQYGFYQNEIKYFMRLVNSDKTINDINTKCGIENKDNYRVISSDGKILSCHNFNYTFDVLGLHDREYCKDCMVSSLCKGGCPAIPKGSDMFTENCKNMYQVYSAIFRYCIYILTGKQAVGIEQI